MHDLDLNLYNVPRSNVNMILERPYTTAYLLVKAMLALSITARYLQSKYECLWPSSLEWGKVKCKFAHWKPRVASYMLAIAVSVISFPVYEIVTYGLANVLNWNFWSWNRISRTSTVSIKIGRLTYLINLYAHAKIRSFRSSHLLATHNREHRVGRTNVQTDAHNAC